MKNISATDIENVTKALHSSQFLVSELQTLVKSENVLLSELAYRELANAAATRTNLERLVSLLNEQNG
jgi:hypothetical protein